MPNKPNKFQPWSNPNKFVPPPRESSTKRGYNSKWQKASLAFKEKHPLCYLCLKQGRITPGTEVDHIIPHKMNMDLFWDSTNWQNLCHDCHNKKTQSERTK